MRWPRGKHNGQKIVGFEIKIKFDLTWIRLKPLWILRFEYVFAWLCFRLEFTPVYSFRRES